MHRLCLWIGSVCDQLKKSVYTVVFKDTKLANFQMRWTDKKKVFTLLH